MCGNSKGSSTVADAVIAQSTPACGVDDCCKSKHLKDIDVSKERDDIKVLKTADKATDKIDENDYRSAVASEGEKPVCESETSSETAVNADKMFENSGNCGPPDHIPLKGNNRYDSVLFIDTESSHSALERDDGSNNVMSSKSDEVSHSRPCNGTSEENESDILLCQEVESSIETEDNESALHDKLVDLEVQTDKTQPSKIVCSVQMLEDDSLEIGGKSACVELKNHQTELSDKSADVEMQNDQTELSEKSADIKVHREQTELNEKSNDQTENVVEIQMQNCQNEHAISGDIEMQDCLDQGSIGMRNDAPDSDRKFGGVEVQDHTELKEVSSHGVGSVGPNDAGDQVDDADEDHHYGQSKPSMKPETNTHFVRIRVRNSSELKAVPSDRAVGEDNVAKTNISIDENGIVSVEKGTSVIEAENAVDNIGGNKFRTYLTWGLTNMLLELFAILADRYSIK
jgi:hypothetical protein